MAAPEVRAPQLQAHTSISVICGACITVCEMRAPQLGVCMAACEVRAPQRQARTSISVIGGARITVCELRAPQLGARMAACEVRAPQCQARTSISVIVVRALQSVKCAPLKVRHALPFLALVG